MREAWGGGGGSRRALGTDRRVARTSPTPVTGTRPDSARQLELNAGFLVGADEADQCVPMLVGYGDAHRSYDGMATFEAAHVAQVHDVGTVDA